MVSETGRIRFRGVRFQTPNSVSFSGLTEFRGANSVSSSQPIICVPKRTHRVFRRTHRVCPKTQTALSSETVLSKQYSARFLWLCVNHVWALTHCFQQLGACGPHSTRSMGGDIQILNLDASLDVQPVCFCRAFRLRPKPWKS